MASILECYFVNTRKNEDNDFVAQHIIIYCMSIVFYWCQIYAQIKKTASCISITYSFDSLKNHESDAQQTLNKLHMYHEAIISLEYNQLVTKLS